MLMTLRSTEVENNLNRMRNLEAPPQPNSLMAPSIIIRIYNKNHFYLRVHIFQSEMIPQLKLAIEIWYPMIWKFLVTISFRRFRDRYDVFGGDSFTKSYQKSEIFLMVKFENVWRSLGWPKDIKRVTQIWRLDHKIRKPENHDFVENLIFFQNLSPNNQNRNKINAKPIKFHGFW